MLRGEDLQSNTEAFLYCMGALKFISGSPAFLPEMIGKGAVEILTKLIRQTSEDTKKRGACLPNAGNLLVQVSAVLEKVREAKGASFLTPFKVADEKKPLHQEGTQGLRDQG